MSLLAPLLFATAQALGAPLSKDEILKAFEEQVFMPTQGGSEKVIIRWEDPVRVGIFTDGLSPDVFADLRRT
jgi:hypothetical protein